MFFRFLCTTLKLGRDVAVFIPDINAALAGEIKRRIYGETGLRCTVGIAP